MMDAFLQAKLDRVYRRHRELVRWRLLAACWAFAALVGATLVGIERWTGAALPGGFALVILIAVGSAAALMLVLRLRRPDYRAIASRIEHTFPDLNGVLLTAVEQPSDEHAPDFLRHLVQHEAIARSQAHDWRRVISTWRFVAIHGTHAAGLACLIVALIALHHETRSAPPPTGGVHLAGNVVITPGNATLERGDTLVVLARFGRELPAGVTMRIRESGAAPRTVPLVRSLGDPMFGTSVANVQQAFTYQLQYGRTQSPEFTVTVFEHPRLVRADAELTYPTYTRLAARRIEDTTRLSAVEGTRISLALQLNKRVTEARLVARDAAKTTIKLAVDPAAPRASLADWAPAASGTYDLVLVDAEGRKNKLVTSFVVAVQPNRRPDLRLASPRGDLRPSALEEITFDGTVWDDFGTLAYGITYTLPDGHTKTIELGRAAGAGEKKLFNYLLSLETLGAAPDDLVAWNLWADDIGPDGKERHTTGDLYFAEVRPFEEVYHESQMPGGNNQQGGGGGNATRRLAELQRQIVSATWNLQHEGNLGPSAGQLKGAAPSAPKPGGDGTTAPKNDRAGRAGDYAANVGVIRDSQQEARKQAAEAAQQVRSPREMGLWKEATTAMEAATNQLARAGGEPGRLADALPPEQAAYRALLKVQAHETSVTRGRRGGGGGGGGASQRQIDQLDLQQADNRYETQRQAQAPQNRQQQEQLAVLNRLQDLARRQQDVNDRLKELQAALQEAKTDAERQQLRERLKRLEDEQRQNLADADALRQRMDQAGDPSALSQQRQQLDRARDDLQRAADATGQGNVGQAVASGTRAERQLQDARDDLRKQSSSQLADDLRDMRGEARDLSRRQEALERQMAGTDRPGPSRKSLSGGPTDPNMEQQIAEQRDRWNKLLDRAKQLSEQADTSEPLVSKNLYDGVRRAAQADDASVSQLQQDLLGRGELTYDMRDRLQQLANSQQPGKALDLAREMMRAGNSLAAGESVRRATAEINDLRQGVERAAESVLGDDAEQLKLARSELEQLTKELQREAGRAQAGNEGGARPPAGPPQRGDGTAPTSESDRKSLADGGSGRGSSDSDVGRGRRTPPSGVGGAPSPREAQASNANDVGRGLRTPPSGVGGVTSPRDTQASNSQRGEVPAPTTSPRTGDGRQLNLDRLLGGANAGGGGGGGVAVDRGRFGPLTGDDYARWTDRLRDVEQLLDSPDLRDAVATARERARLLRRDYSQTHQKPDWAVVELQVVRPLVEVRQRVAEELARHDARDSLAPIDHDPVPTRFAESVRRYYEELGKDAGTAGATAPHQP